MPDSQTTVSFNGRSWNILENAWYGRYWDAMQTGVWEPETIAFVERHCGPGTTLIDIGGWIGQIALLAGSNGASVRTYEPDPVAYEWLSGNVGCNDLPIEAINAAVGAAEGTLELFVHDSLGDSQTSAVRTNGATSITVPMVKLDDIPRPEAFVLKVDIEGYEFELADELVAFCRQATALHLSLHPVNRPGRIGTYREISRLIDGLAEAGLIAEQNNWRAKLRTFRCCFLRRRKKNFTLIFEREDSAIRVEESPRASTSHRVAA